MSRIGDRQLGAPITENIGNLGKLKEAVTLKRGILTEIPYIGGRDLALPDLVWSYDTNLWGRQPMCRLVGMT